MFKAKRLIWYLSGLQYAWKGKTFKTGTITCILLLVIGLIIGIGMTPLVLLVGLAVVAWGLEITNSAIEELCNFIEPNINVKIKKIKDTAGTAPALVYSAFGICWCILVGPTLINQLTTLFTLTGD